MEVTLRAERLVGTGNTYFNPLLEKTQSVFPAYLFFLSGEI